MRDRDIESMTEKLADKIADAIIIFMIIVFLIGVIFLPTIVVWILIQLGVIKDLSTTDILLVILINVVWFNAIAKAITIIIED